FFTSSHCAWLLGQRICRIRHVIWQNPSLHVELTPKTNSPSFSRSPPVRASEPGTPKTGPPVLRHDSSLSRPARASLKLRPVGLQTQPIVSRCPESFNKLVTLLPAAIATGANRRFPRAGLAPARTQHLSRRAE